MFVRALDLLRSAAHSAVLDLPKWIEPMSAAVLSLAGFVLLLIALARTRGRLDGASAYYD
jgi:uncharacterized membrane protein